MKKIIKEVLLLSIAVMYFFYTILYSDYIKKQIIYSFTIWIKGVIPALFPTFIIMDFLCNTNIPYYISKYLHINVFYILSIVGGTPANTIMINKYAEDKYKVLAVSKYVSFIFLYNNLKYIFNSIMAFILIGSNIVANIIITFMVKPKIVIRKEKDVSIINVIGNVKSHMFTLLSILGIIIFFNTLPVFFINNEYVLGLLLSILEVTTFFNYIYVSGVSISYKLLLCVIAISSCGLCIECQIKSIITDTSIDYKSYFLWRLVHLILFMILVFLITVIIV